MNMDFAIQLAHGYAKQYASDGDKNQEHSAIYCARYNGYHAGYMRDCAERESLRAILKKQEAKEKNPAETWNANNTLLEDLI